MMVPSDVCGARVRCLLSFLPSCSSRYRLRPLATLTSVKRAEKKDKVIIISGPTAAGKSLVAFDVARRLNGEIISADSVQIYRGLDVGSAKPSLRERKEVVHHLIDVVNPTDDYSAGQYFDDARKATLDILTRGRVPVVVGGTGLYLRWFIYGKPDVPKASSEISSGVDLELMKFQRNGDWEAAVQLVVEAGDPRAKLLAANDWYRLRRSLEIIKASGSPASTFQVPYNSFKGKMKETSVKYDPDVDGFEMIKSENLDYDFLCFFLSSPRPELYRSIDHRCEDMLTGNYGILFEAKSLLDMGILPNSNSATRAIGYRQAMEYLLSCRNQGGRSSPRDFFNFLSEFQKASRNFAKRQLTWFRNEQIYNWLDSSQSKDKLIDFICDTYHNQYGTLVVPPSLRMEKDLSSKREAFALKSYRAKNRCFIHHDDCHHILDWIQRSQAEAVKLS